MSSLPSNERLLSPPFPLSRDLPNPAGTMAYQEDKLKKYREADEPYYCPTCPYCNGQRDNTVKHIDPLKKPPTPFEFWKLMLTKIASNPLTTPEARAHVEATLKSYDVRQEQATKGAPKPVSPAHQPGDYQAMVVAPMVEQSELPFRMLCRKFGATLGYTPMFHSRSFMESAHYRSLQWSTCKQDSPVFVQFCGHDGDTVLAAAQHVDGTPNPSDSGPTLFGAPPRTDDVPTSVPPSVDSEGNLPAGYGTCDAVDLNLGCPQGIARRGFYGSFLMEHWDVVHTIIHTLHVELRVPVTAKMRLFDDEALTLKYARMLRDAGAQLIAVHGRTREMKGQDTGMADLQMIRKVRDELCHTVPVLENGNIMQFSDIATALETSQCNGAMSAEALLWDPRLFSNPPLPVLTGRNFHMPKKERLEAIETALVYLDLLRQYPVDPSIAKTHLFKMLYHSYEVHIPMRNLLGDFKSTPLEGFLEHVLALKQMEIDSPVEGSLPKLTIEEKKAIAVQEKLIREAEEADEIAENLF